MTGGWAGSTRRDTLPPDWTARRLACLIRDGYRCQWRIGGGRLCGKPANQVDHIRRNGGDSLGNLRALCASHHAKKSSVEGNAAKAARRASRLRTPERHPGEGPVKLTTTQPIEGVGAGKDIDVADDRGAWLLANGYATERGGNPTTFGGATTTTVPADQDPTLGRNSPPPTAARTSPDPDVPATKGKRRGGG